MSGCPYHRSTPPSAQSQSAWSAPMSPAPAVPASTTPITEDDLQCPICLRLLHEPTALHCGHSFCGSCLRAALGEGGLTNCPLCRTELPQGHALSPNVLLTALIEKFLPEAAALRRAEAAQDTEDDRKRHTMVRQVALQLSRSTRTAIVSVQMAGTSRCPMHAGTAVPIGFYVARATVRFPPGWSTEESSAAAGNHWERSWSMESAAPEDIVAPNGNIMPGVPVRLQGLQSVPELNGKEGTCGQRDPDSGRWRVYIAGQVKSVREENLIPAQESHHIAVSLYFQPRFQIAPMHLTLALENGESKLVDIEVDGRLVHQ